MSENQRRIFICIPILPVRDIPLFRGNHHEDPLELKVVQRYGQIAQFHYGLRSQAGE
ncbi:hypothetical protein [Paenibacillus eucommiae]|uniref:Uncharacterized protein n=1 Tax=Paenibacillus eucommiae TaxID=1355755 RepID=A0ABS4JBV6_9BACL|nr:hypothetical protein [Paenibacillus eucommiae]MBP1996224.1 hypothetical protein [Paenibacillus eucommiae]